MRSAILRLFILAVVLLPALAPAAAPTIFGRSAILFDANTGEVLYKKNETMRTPIASTQKLLTGLLIVKAGNLQGDLTVSPEAPAQAPTKLGIKTGERYPRLNVLTALLVKSANDTAVALAVDNAGSLPAFADKMNAEARRLGAKNSHFVNPNGLPNPGQYSTARDLACIARAAYRNPTLRDIIDRRTYVFTYANGRTTLLTNTNRVLRTYSFCNGMKTGYTDLAGHCLVASGAYGGRDMIAVVLKSDKAHVWDDCAKLLEYGLGINKEQFLIKGGG
ncbi:MAG TPA: D-alanyl-D-alanine carboxypeptidase family protein [Chthoniobacterales bacterium]|jgi:D-alanyl-D-alanine carboxypeptidase (penicillin-binding protein 5/6)